MARFLAVAAVAAATLALTPAIGNAQTTRGYYAAVPVSAPSKASVVTRSTVWHCGGGACVASKSDSRDAVMCELVAREVGTLQTFSAGGAAFDADALAKCNTRAK